ncbi:MAG: tail fiber domain-containing protein, partial [Pyrinomonadaceae bacterium]|nr:tail fiber domain-containing protein [Pyrinomonadaceae bacterium]
AANITGVLGAANGGTNLSSPGASGNFLRSNGSTWTSSPFTVADIPNGAVVKRLNNLTDNVTLAAGANITITPTGNTLTIALTGGRSGNAILNQTQLQTSANFDIDGTGKANIFSAGTQYNIGTDRVLFTDFDLGNVYVGIRAGEDNAGGEANTFVGDRAGTNNTTGESNSFFGFAAGRINLDGDFNTFIGVGAGELNDNGNNNTFVGAQAGKNSTEGGNSFFGYNAGASNLTGQSITLIGVGADVTVDGLINATAIGVGAKVDASNTIALGRAGGFDTVYVPGKIQVNLLGAAGSTNLCRNSLNQISTCSSSIRYKTNVNSFTPGINLVRRLRPVSFNWKADGKLDLGLVAEEVADAEPLLVNYNEAGEIEGIKYDRVGVILLNAVKEQQLQIESQAKQNDEQAQIINRQTEQLNQQQINFQKQQAQTEAQAKQLQQQQFVIDGLRKLVCQNNPQAEVCKEIQK